MFRRKKQMHPTDDYDDLLGVLTNSINNISATNSKSVTANNSTNLNSNSSNLYTSSNYWQAMPYTTSQMLTSTVKSTAECNLEVALVSIFNNVSEEEVERLVDYISYKPSKILALELVVEKRHFSEEFLLKYFLEEVLFEETIRKVHSFELNSGKYPALKLAIEEMAERKTIKGM